MLDFLKNWVLTLITLVMFIVLLEIILPNGKTKKVVNMVSGFIIIITMINPILGLFGQQIEFKGVNLQVGNFLDHQEIEATSKAFSEKQTGQIIEVYRRNIANRIKELCENEKDIAFIKAEVQLIEDAASEKFGQIQRIYLDIAEDGAKEEGSGREIEPVKKVPKVTIAQMPDVQTVSSGNKRLITKMEELVGEALQISRDSIVVNVIDQ